MESITEKKRVLKVKFWIGLEFWTFFLRDLKHHISIPCWEIHWNGGWQFIQEIREQTPIFLILKLCHNNNVYFLMGTRFLYIHIFVRIHGNTYPFARPTKARLNSSFNFLDKRSELKVFGLTDYVEIYKCGVIFRDGNSHDRVLYLILPKPYYLSIGAMKNYVGQGSKHSFWIPFIKIRIFYVELKKNITYFI